MINRAEMARVLPISDGREDTEKPKSDLPKQVPSKSGREALLLSFLLDGKPRKRPL